MLLIALGVIDFKIKHFIVKPDKESLIAERLLILAQQNQQIIKEIIEIVNPKKVIKKITRRPEIEAMAGDRLESQCLNEIKRARIIIYSKMIII
jgi:hypothetical protein